MKEANREYGIDVLRVLTSLMVVILHLLYYGNLQDNAAPFSFSYYSCYGLGILCDCAVNCFGLISGYIGYNKKYKISNIVLHHCTVLFFTISITTILSLLFPNKYGFSSFFTAFFPVTSSTYWYYTAYFALFFLTPALNAAVSTLKKRQLDFLLIILLVFLSIVPCILNQDIFHTAYGYSVLWLAVLYFIGAYLKKYHIHYKKRPARHFVVYLLGVVFACILKFSIEYIVYIQNGNIIDCFQIIEYTSPFILLSSISLLLLFSTLSIPAKARPIISFLSRSSFSTYLLHEHPFVRSLLISSQLKYILELPSFSHVPTILISSIMIWFACFVVDQLRIFIFRLLHAQKCMLYLESLFTRLRLYGQ